MIGVVDSKPLLSRQKSIADLIPTAQKKSMNVHLDEDYSNKGPKRQVETFLSSTPVGAGATGVVYRGKRSSDEKPVVVKVLKSVETRDGANSPDKEAELQASAAAFSPFVAKVYGIGTLTKVLAPNSESSITKSFISTTGDQVVEMEFVDPRRGPQFEKIQDPAVLAHLIRQVLEALSTLHQHGIYHCDLKPENIMIDYSEGIQLPKVRLIDFGTAVKKTEPDDEKPAKCLVGSGYYRPSGNAKGPVDAVRSDIFAIHKILADKQGYFADDKRANIALRKLSSELDGIMASKVEDQLPNTTVAKLVSNVDNNSHTRKYFKL